MVTATGVKRHAPPRSSWPGFWEEVIMSRALVLIAAALFFREFLLRPARRSPTAISPYMNSLDGLLSAEQVSLAVDEVRGRRSQMKGEHPVTASTAPSDVRCPGRRQSVSRVTGSAA
jgi:hypothetical protein